MPPALVRANGVMLKYWWAILAVALIMSVGAWIRHNAFVALICLGQYLVPLLALWATGDWLFLTWHKSVDGKVPDFAHYAIRAMRILLYVFGCCLFVGLIIVHAVIIIVPGIFE